MARKTEIDHSRLGVILPNHMKAALDAIATRNVRSMSAEALRAIEAHIQREEALAKKSAKPARRRAA